MKSSKRSAPSTTRIASLDDQRAVLLQHFLEQRHLDAAAAVVEHEAGASAALADLEHQTRHA